MSAADPADPSKADVRPVGFGRPKEEDADAPAWARAGKGAGVTAWIPGEKKAPAPPSPKAKAGVPPMPEPKRPAPEPQPEAAPPPPEPEPEPEEAGIPPGMILISEAELAEREAELEAALRAPLLQAAEDLTRALGEIESRLRDDVVDLAARIASVLTQRALQQDRTVILDIARRALRLLGPLEHVVVKCAEADAELLREHLPQMARAETGRAIEVMVRASDDIAPGSLLLTFDAGIIDAREERRLQRIVAAVKAAVQESETIEEGT